MVEQRQGLSSFRWTWKTWNPHNLHPLVWIIGGSTLILFICSSIRHFLCFSTAYDLGIFDQSLYLLSRGLPPIPSIRGIHVLGDHAAWIFYPLALLYWIYPDIHWLFFIQALGLSLGALPMWALARQAGIHRRMAVTLALVYLLYPVVFNVNLFDFHPEVLAPAALLGAVWAARSQRVVGFSILVILVLSLKAVLGLTVAAMGIWLFAVEKRRTCGAIALLAGVIWFLIATEWIIPTFSGAEAAAIKRYADLGNSPFDIAKTLLLRPHILLSKLLTLPNLKYTGLLLAPVLWGLSPRHLAPLIGAFPILLVNWVTDYVGQKNLDYQYSLPILPFLMLVIISSVAAQATWLRNPRWILVWSLIFFMVLAQHDRFAHYFTRLESWQATREAIAMIQTQEGVAADNQYAAQVSQRSVVKLINPRTLKEKWADITYVLVNLERPWPDTVKLANRAVQQLERDPAFEIRYERDNVLLFVRKNHR